MITKKTVDQVGLEVYKVACRNCNTDNLFIHASKDGPPAKGIHCVVCKTVVWYNHYNVQFWIKAHEILHTKTDYEYRYLRREIEKKFLETFPPCPKCNTRKYTELVSSAPDPVICKNCHNIVEKRDMVDVTTIFENHDIYWYSE